MSTKGTILVFLQKLELFWKNIDHREFSHFLSPDSQKEEIKDGIITYVNRFKNVQNEMKIRFRNILEISVPEWVNALT